MSEQWVKIEGEIIGWLARFDDETDHDIAVVRVDRMKPEGSPCWTEDPFLVNNVPPFALRWIGNDTFMTRMGTTQREHADEFLLGDTIMFTTNSEEQFGYAMWN